MSFSHGCDTGVLSLGKVEAIGFDSDSERSVRADKEDQASISTQAAQGASYSVGVRGAEGAIHDARAKRQTARAGDRVWCAFGIREQKQRWQVSAETRRSLQAGGGFGKGVQRGSMNLDQGVANIAERRAAVLGRIAAAAVAAGRAQDSVTLVAVSKTQPPHTVQAMLDAGQLVYGENRVQEAQERWAGRTGVELRLIGPLQTNKAADAVPLFDVIETLDRARLAEAIARAAQKHGRSPRLMVQVNTGEEAQKAGLSPPDVDAFLETCRASYDLPVEGLMCIPPANEPAGPHFALLAKLAARNGLGRLSMGMSGDFETAIRFGATSVRVGSALFGAREPDPAV